MTACGEFEHAGGAVLALEYDMVGLADFLKDLASRRPEAATAFWGLAGLAKVPAELSGSTCRARET